MIRVRDILEALDAWAPFSRAEPWDRSGLRTGHPDVIVSGCLLALDPHPEVMQEAHDRGWNTVITHHPLLFRSPDVFLSGRYDIDALRLALQYQLNVIAIHTNLDRAPGGVNDVLAQYLELTDVHPLSGENASDNSVHLVRIGRLKSPLSPEEFLRYVTEKLPQVYVLRHNGPPRNLESVDTIAVCGGAGGNFWEEVWQKGIQVYLTADVRYHTFVEAQGRLWILDAGHFETEQMVCEQIQKYLQKRFPELSIAISRYHTHIVRFFVSPSTQKIPGTQNF